MYYKKIVGTQCYLLPISKEDADAWAKWFNDLSVSIPLGDEAYIPTSLEQEQSHTQNIIDSHAHVFSIIDLQNNNLIGRCLLFDVNLIDRNANLGIVIGDKDYWDRGFGTEALSLLLDYGFSLLNLNNIMLGTFEFNKRAIFCYKKLGFKEIGRRRQARIIGGRKYDSIFMDILAYEYQSVYINKFLEQE